MHFIDSKYIGLVSSRLHKFKQVKNGLYNFRCPYCGDSKKHKNKARGYIYQLKNDHNYKCHNCGVSKSFTNFLKDLDSSLHDQYVMERYKNGLTGKNSNTPDPTFVHKVPVFKKTDIDLPSLDKLNKEHPARAYVERRKIKNIKYFYYCENFKEWTNEKIKTFDSTEKDSPRIIIPLKDKEGNLFGYQGRALDPSDNLRYITIMLDKSKPKIFGLDLIDETKTVYITEGPFDSTFIKNSVAMCGADINPLLYGISDCVYIYDNEPRSLAIVSRISRIIQMGQKVVIWPSQIKEKDINDMVLSGLDAQSVVELNTYSGLEANLKLINWKRT
jgi:predicted RNA-binding Zn-ribbon protein involved in translation (DUF1610 family)